MTRERALELATGLLGYPPFEQGWRFSKLAANVISEMILAAVAEEREACARIAEANGGCELHHCDEIVAAEIRDRAKASEPEAYREPVHGEETKALVRRLLDDAERCFESVYGRRYKRGQSDSEDSFFADLCVPARAVLQSPRAKRRP